MAITDRPTDKNGSPSAACSPASADSISASSAPASRSSGSAKPTSSADEPSPSTGRACRVIPTCENFEWPTPTVNRNYNRKGCSPTSGDGLATAVTMRDQSMYSSAGSLARTSVVPGKAPVWQGVDLASGFNSIDSLASYSHESWLSRTSEASLFGESIAFSDAWPTEGMTRSGRLFAHAMLARRTSEPESSSWPTPKSHAGMDLSVAVNMWPTPRAEDSESSGERIGRGTADTLTAAARQWQTPETSDANGVRVPDGKRSLGLNTQVASTAPMRAIWPTPSAMDAAGFTGTPDIGRTSVNSGRTLLGAAMDYPTPASRDYRSPNRKSYRERGGGSKGEQLPNFIAGLPDQASRSTTGSPVAPSPRPVLNPRWVACLMGFPQDWLDGVDSPPRPRSKRKQETSSQDGAEPRSQRSVTPSSRKSQRLSPCA